jgi:hypothetical protein
LAYSRELALLVVFWFFFFDVTTVTPVSERSLVASIHQRPLETSHGVETIITYSRP